MNLKERILRIENEPDSRKLHIIAREAGKLEDELNAANERIKRLEKAGEDLAVCGYFMGFEDELKAWRKAKEVKP